MPDALLGVICALSLSLLNSSGLALLLHLVEEDLRFREVKSSAKRHTALSGDSGSTYLQSPMFHHEHSTGPLSERGLGWAAAGG